jgi:hypothetical protein
LACSERRCFGRHSLDRSHHEAYQLQPELLAHGVRTGAIQMDRRPNWDAQAAALRVKREGPYLGRSMSSLSTA